MPEHRYATPPERRAARRARRWRTGGFYTGLLAAFGIELGAVALGLAVTWLLLRWA